MKALVIKLLNRRIGAPSVNAPVLSPLIPGASIEVEQILAGDKIDGNDTWYKTVDGWYAWSGGCEATQKPDAENEINYWIEKLGIEKIANRGNGVNVALLDSGIHLEHTDFDKNRIKYKSFLRDQSIQDFYGHGTHCAGILFGQGSHRIEGVIPFAQAYIGRVYYQGQYPSSISRLKDGLRWAVSVADVISISLGISDNDWDSEFQTIIDDAVAKDKIVVCSIGNNSNGGNAIGEYPAKYSNCISVGTLDNNLNISEITKRFPQLDICIPGEKITSTFIDINNPMNSNAEYKSLSGTSISTPFLAGILALKKQGNKNFNVNDARLFIESISEKKVQNGFSYKAIKGQLTL
ncbi:MAG: hypothetical protein EHM93_16915 [Bacteroidales bacterium]|nr:MAG: hypothetical protein EHM93_16915 [Bacteroidales bacterium]